MDFPQIISQLSAAALPVLFAITLAEAARGQVAHRLGDRTAASVGRLTWNPARHIDLLGTVVLPLFLFALSGGKALFGYAKPLPVNTSNLSNPRRATVLVELASPLAHFVMAALWGALALVTAKVLGGDAFLTEMSSVGFRINLIFFAFVLLPIPPFPGGRVLLELLPRQHAQTLARLEPYGFFVVVGLIVTGIATRYWLQPIAWVASKLIDVLLSPLSLLLGAAVGASA